MPEYRSSGSLDMLGFLEISWQIVGQLTRRDEEVREGRRRKNAQKPEGEGQLGFLEGPEKEEGSKRMEGGGCPEMSGRSDLQGACRGRGTQDPSRAEEGTEGACLSVFPVGVRTRSDCPLCQGEARMDRL